MTARLDKTARSLDRITSEGKIDDVLKETKAGIADARSLISSTREELKALKLGDTVERANLTVERVDRRTRTIAQEIEAASENLRRTSETLDEFMQRVRTNPSDLIFSKPPTPRRD
jgi:DNA repair ATPase RecN